MPELPHGEVGFAVAAEVADGQGLAEPVVTGRLGVADCPGAGQARGASPDHDGGSAVGVVTDVLSRGPHNKIGVAVVVQVAGSESATERVVVFGSAGNPARVLSDDLAVGRADAGCRAVVDDDGTGVLRASHSGIGGGCDEVTIPVAVEVVRELGRDRRCRASRQGEEATGEGHRRRGRQGGSEGMSLVHVPSDCKDHEGDYAGGQALQTVEVGRVTVAEREADGGASGEAVAPAQMTCTRHRRLYRSQ